MAITNAKSGYSMKKPLPVLILAPDCCFRTHFKNVNLSFTLLNLGWFHGVALSSCGAHSPGGDYNSRH